MNSIKHVASLMAFAVMFASPALHAKEVYDCKYGNQERKIDISYTTEGAAVPCQVVYTKEDGTTQNLWSAQNVEGYCEQKADEFAEKQRGWGWDCQAATVAMKPAEAAPAEAAPAAAQ